MYNPFSLIGKTILVTGASSGIGRAVAAECARMGAKVVLTARNEERLQETLAMLEGEGHQIVAADLCSETTVKTLAEQMPVLSGVVHCAGQSMLKPVIAVKQAEIEQLFAVNCFSPMMLVKYLVKAKKLENGASLVFVSSISGSTNVATALSTYGASKSALSAYVKYAALELSGKQIRCNAILPGRIETTLLQNATMDEQALQQDIAKYPLRRYGQPKEVAQAAVYLLSDAAQWITGTELIVDGGRSIV